MRKKAASSLLAACALAFALCGCTSGQSGLKDDFANYVSETYDNGGGGLQEQFLDFSNVKMTVFDLKKENAANSDVTLFVKIEGGYRETRRWARLPVQVKKADLRKWGALVEEYGKSRRWEDGYRVFVRLAMEGGHETVYDYAADRMWVLKDKAKWTD